jgi:hypothetical protein
MSVNYVSPSGTFSFQYPDNWKMLREADGTLRLWRKAGLLKKESANVLRIKPFVSDRIILHNSFESLVDLRRSENAEVETIQDSGSYSMNFLIIKYKREMNINAVVKTVATVQQCWDLVILNRIFSASFTFPKDQQDSSSTAEERAAAENILYSLKLL